MTPSEFYKQRRPEFFSDSEIISQITLPREILAYELSKISTNQKQDEFETLCRRLAEKFIAPNLIPQVGPTGGGDGKTDSETYPVSESISDRWFTPENGWSKNENWAFAISAKEEWKGKAKSDVKKIVETARGYTRIYFMSNQLISSKKKKDAQDEFIKEFSIDVVILDGEWILEKIYTNNLIDLVVDALNLSTVYKSKEVRLGSNDANRLKELEELEKNINNPNRYSEYDSQLVEDALESAILSRMIEKPREEIEGKFDRVFRFCKKINYPKQWVRLYYQRAWTYLNWYDDYPKFIEDYIELKSFISEESSISEIELHFNLFNLLRSIEKMKVYDLKQSKIDMNIELEYICEILMKVADNQARINSSIIARTFLAELNLTTCLYTQSSPNAYLVELSKIILESKSFLDFPFESTKQIIEEMGNAFAENTLYDDLIDVLAEISGKRNSELTAGETFLKRGGQKYKAGFYRESITYFGKAIVKLAKEETQHGMYLALMGLGMAYESIGLIWASNNCYISACSISFKSFNEIGKINKNAYRSVKQLVKNELFIGRIPSLLLWHETSSILEANINDHESDNNEIQFDMLIDSTLSVRILHTSNEKSQEAFGFLPDIFEKLDLGLAQNASLYKLGFIDEILHDYKNLDIKNENEIDQYFEMVANQPFVEQMMYETSFMSDNMLNLSSNILGTKFIVSFPKDIKILFAAETILAFLEAFLATSMSEILSATECIKINICIQDKDNPIMSYNYDEGSSEYILKIIHFDLLENRNFIWQLVFKFTAEIVARNFVVKNIKAHLKNLFEKEEVSERLSLIFEHTNFMFNIFGDKPKIFFDDWVSYTKPKAYSNRRKTPVTYNYSKQKNDVEKINFAETRHDKIKTISIIDEQLWNQAKWNGFGILAHPKIGLGIILLYKNGDEGKKNFDKWIERFSVEDKEDDIRIAIIKGIDKNNPYSYRVHISSNINFDKADGKIISIASRIHEMTPNSSENLDNLIQLFKMLKQYKLYPAKISYAGTYEPFFECAIKKTSLIIKEAWEIGEHDLEQIVIQENDDPIIPDEHKEDAPILNVLKKKKS